MVSLLGLLLFGSTFGAQEASQAPADVPDTRARLRSEIVPDVTGCEPTAQLRLSVKAVIRVSATGEPVDVKVVVGTDACRELALSEALRTAHYSAATHNGKPFESALVLVLDLPMNATVTHPGEATSPPKVLREVQPSGRECPHGVKPYVTLVRLTVGLDGKPQSPTVVRSSGNECLDEASLTAVKGYRFRPAMKAGQPIAFKLQVEVDFRSY